MAKVVYQQSRIPQGDARKKFAAELYDTVRWYMDSRTEREDIVRQCDEAYKCIRYVPDVGALSLIEDGEFGETDAFDNSNVMSIRLALAIMPRNEPWLTVSSREGDTDQVVQAIQDQQIFLHKKARTRRNMQRVWKQAIVRGRTGVHWEWKDTIVWRRLDDAANSKELRKFLKSQGMSKKQAALFSQGRYPHVVESGPVIMPIDWWDLWVHPQADLVNDRRPGKIVRRFFTLDRLKGEVDELTDEPIYDIPDDFEATPLEELFDNDDSHIGDREASRRLFNRNASTSPHNETQKLVPVYIMYQPKFNFIYDGTRYNYYDTYFYVAVDHKQTPHLIKIEENPSNLGHSQILVDDWIDWFTPTAGGGIGSVEKTLSNLNQKNLMKLLTMTGAAAGIVPAQLVRASAFREGEEVSFLPGSINLVDDSIATLAEAMTPVPVDKNGVSLGEQVLRFFGEEMRASSGVDGLVQDNATRTLSKPKTATEINRDVSTGSFLLDNQAENASDLTTDLVQAIFETSQQRLQPEDGAIEYERYLGDKVQQGTIQLQDFRARRSIQVLGLAGQLNREQDMQNLLKAFEVTGNMATDPKIVPLRYMIGLKLCRKLGVNVPPEMEMSPDELLAQRPDVQQFVIQGLLQNPEVQALLQQAQAGQAAQQHGQHMPPQHEQPSENAGGQQPLPQGVPIGGNAA